MFNLKSKVKVNLKSFLIAVGVSVFLGGAVECMENKVGDNKLTASDVSDFRKKIANNSVSLQEEDDFMRMLSEKIHTNSLDLFGDWEATAAFDDLIKYRMTDNSISENHENLLIQMADYALKNNCTNWIVTSAFCKLIKYQLEESYLSWENEEMFYRVTMSAKQKGVEDWCSDIAISAFVEKRLNKKDVSEEEVRDVFFAHAEKVLRKVDAKKNIEIDNMNNLIAENEKLSDQTLK